MPKRNRRSDRLLSVLQEYDRVVVVTHDTPDPDAIASGWALCVLVRERLGKPVRLIGSGAILRAENVHMVELLEPPLEMVSGFRPDPGTATVLVDCSPEGANQLFSGEPVAPVAVIDHHRVQRKRIQVRFRDLRPTVTASATIVCSYLREQEVEPSSRLATALFYALQTEMVGRSSRFSRTERGILAWLAERADHQALHEIMNAPLSQKYFEDLGLAIGSTFLYDGTALCLMQDAGSAEIVGELADLLIRCQKVERVLCGAVVGESMVFSARTTRASGNAVTLLRSTLKGLGSSGGHRNRAGGKMDAREGSVSQQLIDLVRKRWLKACGVEGLRGVRLVAPKETLEIL